MSILYRVVWVVRRWPNWMKMGLVYGILVGAFSYNMYLAWRSSVFYDTCESRGGFVYHTGEGRACARIPEDNIINMRDIE